MIRQFTFHSCPSTTFCLVEVMTSTKPHERADGSLCKLGNDLTSCLRGTLARRQDWFGQGGIFPPITDCASEGEEGVIRRNNERH